MWRRKILNKPKEEKKEKSFSFQKIEKIKIPDDLFDKPFDMNEWYKQIKKTRRYKTSSVFRYFVYSVKRTHELDHYRKENKSPRCLQVEAVLGETSSE